MERDWVVLKIDEHRMWASLAIKRPEGEETHSFTPEFITAYLKENGIKAGLNEEAIEALAHNVAYEQDVIVACGKPAVNGKDGSYSFLVDMEDLKSKPAIREDGSVDYYNSLKLAMVKENDLFAVYNPPTSGEFGYTIFSEMLTPVKGRDIGALRGSGFTRSENGLEYRASYDGRIIRNENKITIEKLFRVKGDLNLEKGNINFNGDVEITGDVRSGLCIEAEGNVFIHGHVGSCRIKAGKDITIQKGVQGRNKCFIEAGGNVMCSFVERCTINAKGNIYADYILDSTVTAQNQVLLESKSGLVLGGVVTGILGVKVKEAGNDKETPTVIQAGNLSEDLNKAATLKAELIELNRKFEQLEKHIKTFEQIDGSKLTKEIEATKTKMFRAKVVLKTDIRKKQDSLAIANARITQAKESIVHITKCCHLGVRITINGYHYLMTKEFSDIIFKVKREQVVMEGALSTQQAQANSQESPQ